MSRCSSISAPTCCRSRPRRCASACPRGRAVVEELERPPEGRHARTRAEDRPEPAHPPPPARARVAAECAAAPVAACRRAWNAAIPAARPEPGRVGGEADGPEGAALRTVTPPATRPAAAAGGGGWPAAPKWEPVPARLRG